MRPGILAAAVLATALVTLPATAMAETADETERSGTTEVTVQQMEAPAEEPQTRDLDQTGAASLVIPLSGAVIGLTAIAVFKGIRR